MYSNYQCTACIRIFIMLERCGPKVKVALKFSEIFRANFFAGHMRTANSPCFLFHGFSVKKTFWKQQQLHIKRKHVYILYKIGFIMFNVSHKSMQNIQQIWIFLTLFKMIFVNLNNFKLFFSYSASFRGVYRTHSNIYDGVFGENN